MQKLIKVVLITLIFLSGCGIYQTIQNISRLKYRIQSAQDYEILGIDITRKKSLRDFSSVEMLKLTSGLLQGSMPLTFKINIEAKNPNDGTGGYPATDLSIQSFPWRLYLNDKETLNGNIENPVLVPGKGEASIIPINIEFDIVKSIKEKNLDDILAFVLQIGGMEGSTSHIKLITKPVIGTPLGNIEYPDQITIVDKVFN